MSAGVLTHYAMNGQPEPGNLPPPPPAQPQPVGGSTASLQRGMSMPEGGSVRPGGNPQAFTSPQSRPPQPNPGQGGQGGPPSGGAPPPPPGQQQRGPGGGPGGNIPPPPSRSVP